MIFHFSLDVKPFINRKKISRFTVYNAYKFRLFLKVIIFSKQNLVIKRSMLNHGERKGSGEPQFEKYFAMRTYHLLFMSESPRMT